jgi:lipopolysaccharide transport system ATP-binding protein
MEPIITVRDLGKCYTISHQGVKRNDTLRDEMSGWFKNLTHKRTTEEKSSKEEFWALKDVSFDVNPGDRLGIIGRNGAGKSTLLKILSRITEPTTGKIRIKGRVASLLEVGTGFHPELTGRENIYLNGAILGMSRVEIKKKFDEIVAFSEVEKFLDTPVKRYSSGMYVRLAFAVAAHLEPEILIIDEVLAVGDAQFQKKCLGKMEDVSTKEGRTVLFVSHNMGAIQYMCPSSILLKDGEIAFVGDTIKAISQYLETTKNIIPLNDRIDRKGTGNIRITAIIFEDKNGKKIDSLISGQYLKIKILYNNYLKKTLTNLKVDIGIDNEMNERICWLSTDLTKNWYVHIDSTVEYIELIIDKLPLAPGRFGFTIFSLINNEIADWIQNAAFVDVEAGDYYGIGKMVLPGQGNFLIDHKFKISGGI